MNYSILIVYSLSLLLSCSCYYPDKLVYSPEKSSNLISSLFRGYNKHVIPEKKLPVNFGLSVLRLTETGEDKIKFDVWERYV